jgi:putative ABC transport system permease protein
MAEMSPNSDISYIYTFSVIAIFILLIACINFMNLTTARSAKRAKEVGIRKVHGAVRKQLIMQFISESIVLSLITLIISLLLVEIFLPRFGEVVGRELDQSILTDPAMMLKYAALTLFVGFVAGSYPAFYLSSFNPAGVLKGVHFAGNGKTVTLRNVLVVFQFVISIFLIVATGIISDQIEFMQNKRLGFDKERVMIVDLRNQRLRDKVGVLKQELKTIPAVEHVSASTMSPGSGADGSAYFPEGEDNMDPWLIFHAGVDCDYIETMGMTMIRGRNFSKDFFGDTAAVIINRTLWEKTGWGEDVIGKKIKQGDPMNDFGFTVIGVVDDFHFASLHDKVEPFLFYVLKDDMHKLCIRVKDGDMANHLGQIHDAWSRLEPDFPFEYRFLDQSFGELYNAELRLSKMYVYFTIIAIFIACLGLFGLSSYLAEQRTKEIGIRKTFGATAGGLALMLTKDFTRWISLANLIAWPAAYLFMEKWLSQFAFRISLPEHWYVFVYAAILSFLIAVITVSFQAYRAATINPADSLKYE